MKWREKVRCRFVAAHVITPVPFSLFWLLFFLRSNEWARMEQRYTIWHAHPYQQQIMIGQKRRTRVFVFTRRDLSRRRKLALMGNRKRNNKTPPPFVRMPAQISFHLSLRMCGDNRSVHLQKQSGTARSSAVQLDAGQRKFLENWQTRGGRFVKVHTAKILYNNKRDGPFHLNFFLQNNSRCCCCLMRCSALNLRCVRNFARTLASVSPARLNPGVAPARRITTPYKFRIPN